MSTRLSVIIPIYNQQVYLRETIESVLNQSFVDFELILADDGSTDDSHQIIKNYAARDKRIVPIFFSNAGKAETINKAAKIAKGQFCAFLDHDDIMMPNRLEKQLAFHLANPHVAATSSHCYHIDDKGRERGIQRYNGLKNEVECKLVINENHIVLCAFTAIMIDREVFLSIGGLNQTYWPCDDFEFTNRIFEQGHLLIIIQEPLMKYRVHLSSESMSKQWKTFEFTDFASNNILLRRAGKPEIDLQTFRQNRKSRSLKEKIKFRTHNYSVIYWKRAGFSLYAKHYLKFICQVGMASILDINYVMANVRKRKYYANNAQTN